MRNQIKRVLVTDLIVAEPQILIPKKHNIRSVISAFQLQCKCMEVSSVHLFSWQILSPSQSETCLIGSLVKGMELWSCPRLFWLADVWRGDDAKCREPVNHLALCRSFSLYLLFAKQFYSSNLIAKLLFFSWQSPTETRRGHKLEGGIFGGGLQSNVKPCRH